MARRGAKILRHAARGALYLGRHRRHVAQLVREIVLLMGRTLFEPLALFLSPFAAYAVYLILRARYPLEIEHWTSGRVSVLTLHRPRRRGPRTGHAEPCRAARTRNVRAGAPGERRAGAGADRMNRLPGLEDGRLRDLRPLMRGPLARALQALNGGRRGDAPRRRRGARSHPRPERRKTSIWRRRRGRTR